MNRDCISRQDAIDAVSGGMCSGWDCDVIDKLKALPSAEPEIIRCRNCKYYMSGSDDLRYCFNHDDDILWQDDDFCSRAERREE